MDRDAAHLEVVRLLEQFKALPYTELRALVGTGALESQATAPGELITFAVSVSHRSSDSVLITVSAFGNNWWKHERLDESVVVTSRGN